MSCNPLFVVRLDLAPLVGDVRTFKLSARPYPTSDGYEGSIRGGVVSIGDIRQAMCDLSGSPQVNTCEFTYFDRDGVFRALLADPNTEYLTAQDLTVLFGSDEAVRAEDYPLFSLFRGQLLDPSPLPGRLFSFNAESRLGTRKGPYDNDSPVNQVTAQRAVDDGFLAVPRESLEKRLPALWGEKTDKGTTNEFDALIEMGLCGAVNLGPLPGTTAHFLPKPEWGTPQKYLSGSPVSLATALGTHTYTYIFGARTIDGQWSLSDPLTLTGMPAPDAFVDDGGSDHRGFGTGVRLFVSAYTDPTDLAANTNATTGSYMGNLWVKDGAADSPSTYHHMDATDGEMPGAAGYDENGDDSHYKAFGPALPARPLAQTNAEAGDFWCFLRHPGTIEQLFLTDLGGGSGAVVTEGEDLPAGSEAAYALITTDDLGNGVDLGPDGTGYEATVNGHYYFGVILSGAKGLAARDGSFPPRANLCGWLGDNDLLINQAAYGVQDVVAQMTGGPNGRGSEDGTRLPIGTYASFPSVPIIQTTTFTRVQDITKAYLGTDLGYLCCIYFGPDDASTWREHWQQVWTDWGFDHFENEHGQVAISVMDDTESPTSGTLLRERIEIARVLDAGKVSSSNIQNLERYETGYAPIEGTYRSGVQEIRDPVSIARYGERGKGEGAVTSHKYTDDPATAHDAAGRFVGDRSVGPSYPEVIGKLKHLIPIPLGRQFRIQHSDLITDTPIPVYLRERTISPSGGTIALKGRSRTGTYAVRWAEDSVPAWEDATAEQRATRLTWANDDGTMSDGSLGTRWR